MGFYRKKPVVIEAFKFTEGLDLKEAPHWMVEAVKSGTAFFVEREDGSIGLIISTLEGVHEASPGDWIIRGIKGELYPCKPDIFEATYERVERI